MEATNAIVAGDSFSAIQWGSGRSKWPWRLADWVEEIHYISSHLNCTFHHILGEANKTADLLAREGALY